MAQLKGAFVTKDDGARRRIFSREFKLQVIREVESGVKSQAQAAREYQLTQHTISKWRREHRRYKERAFSGQGRRRPPDSRTEDARVAELERMVGRLAMENDILKKLLRKLEERV
jgi:transposase